MDPWWRDRAACAGTDLSLWFPVDASHPDPKALTMCSRCVVRGECLGDVLAAEGDLGRHLRHGIRGGTTPRERAVLAGVEDPQPVVRERAARKPKSAPRGPAAQCARGHELTEANVKLLANGRRACRTCRRETQRQRRHARASAGTVAA